MYRTVNRIITLRKASFYSLSVMLSLSAAIIGLRPGVASAGTLGQTMVRFDRLQTSQQTTGTVCAKPVTTAAEASVQVVFPTGYTLGAAGTFTTNTTNTNWPTGALGWLGMGTATNVTGQTVTFPSSDLTASTLYCFNWTSSTAVQVTASTGSNNTGSVTTRTSVPATIDSATYSTVSMASDQISVTASVAQAFTYALSGTTDNLGSLTTGSVSTSPTPRTLTINTNAGSGWMVWAQDATSGLKSPSTNYTIPSITPGSNSTLSAGTEGYNMGVTSSQTSGSGTLTVATGYVGGSTGKGGGLDTSLRTIASSNGTANNAVLTLTNNAAISATTAGASDYADTITLPAAAMF